ncbi:MAG: hypothetical protein ACJ8ER_13325 [Allosphingosinicella sp.]
MISTVLALLLAATTAGQFAEKAKLRSGLPYDTRIIYSHLRFVMQNKKMAAVRLVDPTGVIVMVGGNSPTPKELPASPAAVLAMYMWVADGDDKMSFEADCKELGTGRVRCLFSKVSGGRLRTVPVTYINERASITRIVVEAPILGAPRG